MRAQITISTDSYEESSTGQFSASSTTVVGTFFAAISKPTNDIEDLTMNQYSIEETFAFRIRKPSFTVTKQHYVVWNTVKYGIIGITSQLAAKRAKSGRRS